MKPHSKNPEWYTPPRIFKALGLEFDLDPASPDRELVPWIPARDYYTRVDDGLSRRWYGRVWLNPPYGRGIGTWTDRMISHGNGACLVYARTDTPWFQRLLRSADAVVWIRGRIRFIRPNGEDDQGRAPAGCALFGWSIEVVDAMARADLGEFVARIRAAA